VVIGLGPCTLTFKLTFLFLSKSRVYKALLFLGAGILIYIVPDLNLAIFWELLYNVLNTGQSEGNLGYEALEILRGHTLEVINCMSLSIPCGGCFLPSGGNFGFNK
jgi:hypothetical protein